MDGVNGGTARANERYLLISASISMAFPLLQPTTRRGFHSYPPPMPRQPEKDQTDWFRRTFTRAMGNSALRCG
jgi:hypothetical protein